MWVIRKTTRDQTGNLKSRFYEALIDDWVDDHHHAKVFETQGAGNEYAINHGIYFLHGFETVDIVQMI